MTWQVYAELHRPPRPHLTRHSAVIHKMEKVLKTWSHTPKKIDNPVFQKPNRAVRGVDTVGLRGAFPWLTGRDRADSQAGLEPGSHSGTRSRGRTS